MIIGVISVLNRWEGKMHRLLHIMVLVCIVIQFSGCLSASVEGKLVQSDLSRIQAPAVTNEQLASLRDGNNTFAFDLYHRINSGENANLIFSPYSIWLAFSMVYAGAQGETENQLAGVFHFLDQDGQHTSLNAVDQRLRASQEAQADEGQGVPFQLDIANAAWGQRGFAIKPAYLDLLATQYGAGMRIVDFSASPEEARGAINDWVSENTGGKIKEIAGPGSITVDIRFVLTNAIYFKASWNYKFDQSSTADGPFTLLDGSKVNTPLMHVGAPLDYIQTVDYQAVRLPYVGYKVEMWVILPAEGRFDAVQFGLGPGLMTQIDQQVQMQHVTLTMPSFEFESQPSLNDLLPNMGLTKAFCPEGDYGGISENGGLCIGQAVHKATIKVDEEGTEATAATMVAMPASIMQEVTMKVDRPFIYAIIDRESGLILFLGQVLNPALH
jgi:serine protease inhibitor